VNAIGPTGPTGPDPETVTLRYGHTYAFRVNGIDVYLELVRLDGTTGFLELTEVDEDEHFDRITR
jgi:hypothetical protein